MENKFAEIINEGRKSGKTIEAINKELKEAGVTEFHLEHLTEEELAAKREREDEEGFIPATEEAEVLPKTPDMRRRKDLAGREVRQKTKTGVYDVTYDEDGYAVKAKRVQMA